MHTNGSNSSVYVAFGVVVAVHVLLILILSVLSRHATLIEAKNRPFARPIMQINISLNCARIANICRMREVSEKPDLVEIILSSLGQRLPAHHEKYANEVGVGTACEEIHRPGRSWLTFPRCWGCRHSEDC